MSEIYREESPEISITIEDEFEVILTRDNTCLMLYDDENFNYILVNDEDSGYTYPIFGQVELMQMLCHAQFDVFWRKYPDDQDVEWFIAWEMKNLEIELGE